MDVPDVARHGPGGKRTGWSAFLRGGLLALAIGCTTTSALAVETRAPEAANPPVHRIRIQEQTPGLADLARHRAELLDTAAEIAQREGSGLERYADFIQRIADGTVDRLGGVASTEAVVRAFLDDLVDVSVPADHATVKGLVMVSPCLVPEGTIHESDFGTSGFAPRFLAGEGIARHFAMSGAAAYVFPPLWVELVGRRIGGDLFPVAGTDGASDVAVNAVGREFGVWLRTVDGSTFRDGTSVGRWVRERFGEGVP